MPPIDPNTGLFDPFEVRHSPGPGGAGSYLGGVLDFLNAFKGQDLANQSQSMRDIEGMHRAQQLQPMDYEETPGMSDIVGTATGLGPEGATAMNRNMPEMQFRNQIAQLQQQYPEGIPDQELENVALSTGQHLPQMMNYRGRQQRLDVADTKNFGALLQKQYAEALKQADTDREARRKAADVLLTTHPQFAAALENFVAMGSDQPTPYSQARKKKTEAQTEGAVAGAEAARARGRYYDTIAEPTATEKYAKAGLSGARQKLIEVQTEIEQLKAANGGVLPEAQKPRLLAILTQLEGKQLSASAMASVGIKPDPAAVADIKGAIKEVKAQLSGAAQKKAASYKSPEDVKAAVKAGTLSKDDALKILKSDFGFAD